MEAEQILERLIQTDSVFGNEEKIGRYLESLLVKMGFKTQRQPIAEGRFNIFAERAGEGSPILFYGHMDTVVPHGRWKHGPLNMAREGDRMYGLGACDMKGGISAMLSAVSNCRPRGVKVLLCADEENISQGAWAAIRKKEWFKDISLIVSCEAGDSKKHTGGANIVTVGRRGRVVIEADVYGLSAHGANPQRGVNAINEASKIVQNTDLFKLRIHRNLGAETIFVRCMEGKSKSALDLPDRAHLEFDIQLVPPSSIKDAKYRVESMVKSMKARKILDSRTEVTVAVKKRPTPYIEPYENSTKNAKIKAVLSVIRKNLGEPVINYGSSVADDNIFANALDIPIVTIGPEGGNEHAPNEWVSRRSLEDLEKVYCKLIGSF